MGAENVKRTGVENLAGVQLQLPNARQLVSPEFAFALPDQRRKIRRYKLMAPNVGKWLRC